MIQKMKHIGILIGFFLLSIGSLSAALPYNLYRRENAQFDFNLLYKAQKHVTEQSSMSVSEKPSSQEVVPQVKEFTQEDQENANYAYLAYLAVMRELDVTKATADGLDIQRINKLYQTTSSRQLKAMSERHSEDLERYKK